eukprot:SAG31_NODE_702_length_12723_cov_4.100206_3_plen_89_part_00
MAMERLGNHTGWRGWICTEAGELISLSRSSKCIKISHSSVDVERRSNANFLDLLHRLLCFVFVLFYDRACSRCVSLCARANALLDCKL